MGMNEMVLVRGSAGDRQWAAMATTVVVVEALVCISFHPSYVGRLCCLSSHESCSLLVCAVYTPVVGESSREMWLRCVSGRLPALLVLSAIGSNSARGTDDEG